MGSENVTKKGVDIVVNGEKHKARFTLAGLAYLSEKYGTVNRVMEVFQGMSGGSFGMEELDAMSDLLYAGLLHEGGEYTKDRIMDTLDVAEIIDITPKLVDAFVQSMGIGQTKQRKNPPKA